jgi:tetratricopeptide (TPR) repeat protein
MTYSKWNTYLGWIIFAIASAVYLMTIESTASLWDCGEYITAAYKLEVGHPPGAPLFMVLGRLFSFFAAPENVAVYINALSAISSSLTILFMFWSLTLLIKKMVLKQGDDLSGGTQIAIFSAAAIGSLAYTFSDSFWFSAVEGEVYAMASLFTAVIFWAILKWDEEMEFIQHGSKLSDLRPNRWLLLIFFMLGLAIGVHLLGILVVPAIGYMIYFRTQEQVSIKGLVLTGVISIVALGFIQEAVIPGSIAMASSFEVSFVNSLGLPFYTGTIFFFILLISACLYVVRYAHRAGKTILYNAMMGLVMLLIGYGSFAVIVIRSNANTPLDENDPENLVTLHSYLKREQYGSAPILFGPYWNSFRNGEEMTEDGPKILDRSAWKDLSAYFLRRFVVIENDVEVKAFASETEAEAWVKANKGAYSIEEKYYESNASIREGAVATYSQTTFFPRMYNGEGSGAALHRQLYAKWSGYNENDGTSTEIGRDGKRLPTFGENLTYFFRYQVNFMYMRYFMWNFAGRQNDLQGHGDNMHGNWLSGISFLDEARLGSQEYAPYYTQENPGRNTYFMLPLILALLGLIFHYRKMPKDAFILTLAFLFTGLAIVVYLNQKPYEPRERDYAYAGSFYFFAMWIGIGVYAIFDLLKKYLKESKVRAGIATALGLIVPVIMGTQNWDDHDRSGKTSARDLAHNYLESCGKNGILFTNGDNDTFPLWYLQEVEGKRTDVRVCNLSLMGTDWYTNQMKLKTYESDPLPIKFREDQILMYAGNTDQVYFMPLLQLFSQNLSDTIIKKVLDLRLKHNPSEAKMAAGYFDQRAQVLFADVVAKTPEAELLKSQIASTDSTNMIAATIDKYQKVFQLFEAARNGQVEFKNNSGQDLQELLEQYERIWSAVDFADAMAFVRDDANMITDEQNKFSFFPSSKFALKVNRQNAIASGVLSSKTKAANVANEIVFEFDPERTQALPRDEVMMMDVVANNDWKRGIYFSSNRGSSFSIALLSAGYIKQVGMAYALTPAKKEPALMDVDQMEKNMLETYIFGDMANPNVLTDYYARRHTIQYRANFLLLAEQLYALGRKNEAIKVLDRSMQIMPEETVMDYGDINPVDPFNSLNYNKAHNQFMFQGQDIRPLNAGILHEFVQLYYLLGQTKKAEALGQKLLENYQTVVAYFEHSDVEMAGNEENAEDLIAVADALLKMRTTVKETNKAGNSSAFGRSLEKTIQVLYKKVLPRIYSGLDALASENGEAGDGLYTNRLANLQLYMGALAEHHGLVKAPVVNRNTLPSEPSNIDVNSLAAPGQATDTNRMMQ